MNLASLGYGDIVMSKSLKLLRPLEAVNGVLMVGMSGAALMAVLQQSIRKQQELRTRPISWPHAPGIVARRRGARRQITISRSPLSVWR